MPGLLGFPVMAALGPLIYAPDNTVHRRAPRDSGAPTSLWTEVMLSYKLASEAEQLICRLDSGADNTVFTSRSIVTSRTYLPMGPVVTFSSSAVCRAPKTSRHISWSP